MECKCGGITTDRTVVRNGEPAGEYVRCTACGRTTWRWMTPDLEGELSEAKGYTLGTRE